MFINKHIMVITYGGNTTNVGQRNHRSKQTNPIIILKRMVAQIKSLTMILSLINYNMTS